MAMTNEEMEVKILELQDKIEVLDNLRTETKKEEWFQFRKLFSANCGVTDLSLSQWEQQLIIENGLIQFFDNFFDYEDYLANRTPETAPTDLIQNNVDLVLSSKSKAEYAEKARQRMTENQNEDN